MAFKFLKTKNILEGGGRRVAQGQPELGETKMKCSGCKREIALPFLEENEFVCSCGHHLRISSRQRINMLTDEDAFEELFSGLNSENPLEFPEYEEKLAAMQRKSGEEEAVVCGTAEISGMKCCIFVMNPYFMMGSMGSVVGEKITRTFEYAAANSLPVIGWTVSGGARMQEGMLSLMQMAKTSAAVKRHNDKGLLYIAVLTDPTTGGVTASFAMEADIILAEPGATVGFAGARIIEQTTGKALPYGFQTAEFVQEHGFIDIICNRKHQKKMLANLLKIHGGKI